MPNVEEFGRKISLTLGALAFLAYGIFQGTTMYNDLKDAKDEIQLLEQRMDKRYKRMTEDIISMEDQVYKQDKEIRDFILELSVLKEHLECIHDE